MAQLNTLNSLRISLVAALVVLAGGAVASTTDWQPRSATVGVSRAIPATDSRWKPRMSLEVQPSGMSRGTDAGWSPRSAIVSSAQVELSQAEMTVATWRPRAAIANPRAEKPTAIVGWAPRASLEGAASVSVTMARRHRGNASVTVMAAGEYGSTPAVQN